jgi:outer membrane protein, heavy metal efflux system
VESRWHQAQVRLAQSLRRSGLRLNAGLRRVEATDDFGFVAGFSMPLAVRDQTLGQVREAREREAQTAAAAEAARLELRATLFAVYQEMLHARTALTQLRGKIIPDAEQSHALARQGYHDGRFSLLDLLDAQQALLALRAAVVTNATAFHLHVIEIERLLGAPLHAAAAQP